MRYWQRRSAARQSSVVREKRTMTPEQQKDIVRLRRYIFREGLVSVMNNTKWVAAINALASIQGYQPRFRVKCVRDPEFLDTSWDTSFPWHIPTFVHIERLEVNPIMVKPCGKLASPIQTNFTPAIKLALESAHVPFLEANGIIKIVGYMRSKPQSDQRQ